MSGLRSARTGLALQDWSGETSGAAAGAPRWLWTTAGSKLFGAGGIEYSQVSTLTRVEVERLLTLGELDAVQVDCGSGITEWVDPSGARRLWLGVEQDLQDVEGWRPPPGARGMLNTTLNFGGRPTATTSSFS